MTKKLRLTPPFIIVTPQDNSVSYILGRSGIYLQDMQHPQMGVPTTYPNVTVATFLRNARVDCVYKRNERRWVSIRSLNTPTPRMGISTSRTFASMLDAPAHVSANDLYLVGNGVDDAFTISIRGSVKSVVERFATHAGIQLPSYTKKVDLHDPEEAFLSNLPTFQNVYAEMLGGQNFGVFEDPQRKGRGSKYIFLVRLQEGDRQHIRRVSERTLYNYLKLGVTREERLAAIRGSLSRAAA